MLFVMLALCLGVAARAEEGVSIEVIKMDGVSVVVLTPEETLVHASSIARGALPEGEAGSDLALPESLTLIGEEAFMGVSAERVEVSGNVVAIEARAFADCRELREITIPKTVLKIDDSAFDGCEDVTVRGTKGSEAERIAKLCGFTFVDPNAQAETPLSQKIPPAPVLPLVPLG